MPQPANPAILNAHQLRQCAGVVCVALGGEDLFTQAQAAVQTAKFVEFRLDSLADPAAALPTLRSFLAEHPDITAIATCRRAAYGGSFNGTAAQQLEILNQASNSGCLLVDIEIETAEELGQAALDELRSAGTAVIVSWHDFAATPPLQPVIDRMQPFAPDFLKLVPTAQTLRDSLQVIDLLENYSGENLVAMSMGFRGVLTRVLGPRFGSVFTFAAPDGAAGTAPGQPSLTMLRDLYRIQNITAKTAIYAVAGEPITGSMSPRMHNTAFAAAGIDAVYLPLETSDPAELQQVMQRLDIRGLSITMPLKETVLPLLAMRDPAVEHMAACNTLLRRADGSLAGFNTDVSGIVEPLQRITPLAGKRVLVLGAGGAARAAVYGLVEAGAHVFILNRTESKAATLAAETGATVQTRSAMATADFDIIVNGTPYGMRGQQYDPPILPVEMDCRIFFDLVYNPVETPLVRVAMERNIRVLPGVAMFVEQGVRQFTLWTNTPAPEGEMLRAVMDALQ